MPDGKTHHAYNLKNTPYVLGVFAILGLTVATVLGSHYLDAALVFVGQCVGVLLLSRWIDPDLDQLGLTSAEGRLLNDFKIIKGRSRSLPFRVFKKTVNELGGWIGFLIAWWAMPYAYIMRYFGGHRGLSHVHIVGTITRVVWMFWPLVYLWWWFYFPYFEIITPLLLGAFTGLCAIDSLHIHLDRR